MIRNKFFRRIIVVTLTAALLLVTGSRAIRVSALAEIAPDVSPVFDTQVYQLQDYIDNGGLTDPQYDIFLILAGMYALAQSGSQGYKLVDPFQYSDGVWNWLKSLGVRTYNSVIGLIPDTARMPITGQIYSTIPFKKSASLYVATLMGIAEETKKYTTVQEFKDTVAQGSYYLPWNWDVQKGMNSIFGIYGGIYSWQFDTEPFEYNASWNTGYLSASQQTSYDNAITSAQQPTVRVNMTNGDLNIRIYSTNGSSPTVPYFFRDYCNLFINSQENKIYIVNNSGIKAPEGYNRINTLQSRLTNNGSYLDINNTFSVIIRESSAPYTTYLTNVSFNLANYDNKYVNVVRAYFNNQFSPSDTAYFFQDWIKHVYVGTNWLNKQEIYNVEDLNFDEPEVNNDIDNYVTVPDYTEWFIDIHDLVTDLLNTTDLINVILNHIVDINGVPVHDTDLIRVTTSIYDLLQETNPVLPINLNDVSEYTDNTYMDLVKEHATSAGSALAALVAFWHNCDAELIYVMFGAALTVLVGAFIGKWGHS